MKLDYKKMLKEIDSLVQTDFCCEMEYKKKYSQKDAETMAEIISKIYLISHCLHCRACQGKYINKFLSKKCKKK